MMEQHAQAANSRATELTLPDNFGVTQNGVQVFGGEQNTGSGD